MAQEHGMIEPYCEHTGGDKKSYGLSIYRVDFHVDDKV